MPQTLEFHIKPQDGKPAYSLEVFERESSQPLAQSAFEFDVSSLTKFEIGGLDIDPKDPHGRMERIRRFGARLYAALFSDGIKKLWEDRKKKADFLDMCIRISPEADELEMLPWETLHDGDEFIAAGAKTGVSRLPLDIELRGDLPAVPSPLRMLALMSSPLDLAENERLNIEREQEILLHAVNSPAGLGKLLLDFEDEAKLDVIEGSLDEPCRILHYSGHGIAPEAGGGLLLEDSAGKKRPVPVAEVVGSLEKAEKDLRLAVISGCQTARTLHVAGFADLARALLRRGIPAVVAMQFSISDAAGLLLAEALYGRLVEGQALDVALSGCRRALLHNDDAAIKADAFAPVLLASCTRPLKTRAARKKRAEDIKIDFALNLPLPQLGFGFYGRRREYRAIRDGLLQKNHRAIIIHGIGGIGKTALAAHTVKRIRDRFAGVYAFDCTSAVLAPETILLELHRFLEAQKIDVLAQLLHQSIPPDQLAGFISQVLTQLPLLIVFDNFETHLTPEGTGHRIADDNLAIFIKTLVKTTASGSRFIFTTRHLFDIDAKRIGDIQEAPLGDLSLTEALGLMLRLPNLGASSVQEKGRAFETFGGHPYALVALDRHCAKRPLADILADARAVHAELREFIAIELSYNRLSDRGRQLFDRLAAFRKPVPHEAAEWVMADKIEKPQLSPELLNGLDRTEMSEEMRNMTDDELLAEFNKLVPERRSADVGAEITELIGWGLLTPIQADGQIRAVAVHSLVRDFCRDTLDGDTWKAHLRDAAAFYTNRTKLLARDDKTPAAVWTELEAFELLFEAGQFEDAASLLIRATTLLDRWGFGRLLESHHNRVASMVGQKTQSMLLNNIGVLLRGRGEYGKALEYYEKSLSTFEVLGDRAGVSASLHNIGVIRHQRGDYDKALEYYEKSLKIREALGDRAGVASSLHQMGLVHQHRGDYDKALEHYERSLRIFEAVGDNGNASKSLHEMGNVQFLRGDYDKAFEYYEKSLKTAKALGDRAGIAQSHGQLGTLHQQQGRYDAALSEHKKALETFEALSDPVGASTSLHQIGIVHQQRGDYDKAIEYYEKSLKTREQLGDRLGIAQSHGAMGQLFRHLERYPEALDHTLTAFYIVAEIGSPDVAKAVADLRRLRVAWGEEAFDRAWREKTGQDVPDVFKQGPGEGEGGEGDRD